MDILFSKAICLHVTTYESLSDRGSSLVPFINDILIAFVPYLKKGLVIELEKTNHRSQRMLYNEKNINKVYKMLLNQELVQLLIIDYYEWDDDPHYDEDAPPATYPQDFCLGISCNYASNFPTRSQELYNYPNGIGFSLSDRVLGGHIPQDIQQKFIVLFERALSISRGVTGFITYETIAGSSPMMTPFENYYKIPPFSKPGYRHHVKGYFWMNFLSELHIASLGGLDYITEHAPCFSQKRWPSGVQLQLSADINNYSDDQLRELRAFLSPLFPPNLEQVTPLEFYGNPIHRLVE
ncbi:hypothetical protein [Paenibacillus sp. PL2-23]|uniref:hypothetical protein n=1 Tax=Paenibacillus sp. PL2-23 TaxID=2100729 RepID=UPI0030FA12EA